MKTRARIVSGLAALAALFLAPIAEASLTRATSPAVETLALTTAAPAPSEFSLFDGSEIARAAAESGSAENFHPLAAVSLLSKNGAEAPLVSVDELIYPKTRYRVFGLLGTPILGVERGVSLELRWGSGEFRARLASGTVGWLSQDPMGDIDSPNHYGFVGARPHEATDPMGTCLGLDNVPCWDYATELVKVPFYNVRDVVVLAGKSAAGAVDLASGGRISAAKKAYDTFQATPGSTDARVDAAAAAYSRQQTNVMTLGFSEAPNKLQHAGDLVGIGAIDRGTTRLFNGIVDRDFDAAGRGFAEAAGGTGQLAGAVATVYAPFAPKSVAVRPAAQQPVGGVGVVLRDAEGATAAEIAASRAGPTAGTRVGQARIRQKLLDEAAAKGELRCWRCGQTSTNPSNMQVGHRNVPLSKAGSLDPANVCLEGAACNLSSGNRGAPSPGMSCAERGGCGTPFGRPD